MADDGQLRIFDLQSVPLDNILFHSNCEFITRLAPQGFPLHLAVHEVKHIDEQPPPYVELHSHDTHEVNILVSNNGDLIYLYCYDGQEITVKAPACIWIPAGVAHAAYAISGSGTFVCMVLSEGYSAHQG